ncbi:hypothetical protein [Rhizobium sp. Leaf341]|uniref:hypothetical protein n=1 Tax=Rhizobium sp. Leaf341 TaxID=1736344 RepID=UPI0007135F40|nr:hypothetical protein [Rhizobium sp. Leaf341]KQR75741.1 hypothetical protein ASG03_18900 [Rhizobium sp. Leaf341]
MLKRLALSSTALTFFLLTADQAFAGPLIGAVIGVFSAVVSGAGVANAIVSLALAAGTTLLQMATAADKPPPVGMKVQADVGDDQPVSTTIGKFATRGKRKYVGTWGNYNGDTPNSYLTEVFEIGSLPVPALDGIWIDGERGTILWNEPDTEFGRGYPVKEFRDDEGNVHDYCWVKFYDGSQTAADPFLLEQFGDDEDRPWDATMIGRGIPYVIMTYRWERTLFKGQPKALFEPAPLPLYDVRKDSTQGGNGTHRFGVESTYEPTENLSVMTYNVIRGLRYKGEWFYGGQDVDASRMPASNWIAAHQEAAKSVKRPGDTTEPQWRGGYEITGDTVPLAVLEELRKAQNGRLTDQGGVFKMKNGTFGGAVFSFHDDDIGITDPSGFDPFNSVDQTINGINGKYPNPKEGWIAKDAPPLRNAGYEALDGKRNLADVSFGATSYHRQVQQLMRGILEEARRFRRHQIPLPPMAYVLEAGIDVVAWTSPHNGYVNKRFLVVERRGQMGMNQIVTLQEIDPTDYDWTDTMEQTVSDGWVGRLDTPTQPMTGWNVSAGTISGSDGIARRPTIVVSCAPNLVDVARVRVRVRLKATGVVVFENELPYGPGSQWTLTGLWLWPATQYEVQGRLVPYSGRKVADSAWISVTTANIGFATQDVLDNAITQQKIIDAAISANKIMDAAITALKLADKAVTTNKLAIAAVTKDIIASGAIVADKFADGLGPVGIISGAVVPTTKTTEVITVAGKLYRWNGTKYTADVPAADIAGTISGSQIADAALDATKFANGLSPVTNVSGSTLPTTKSTDVINFAGKLYRWTGSAYSASVPTQDLTGTITANQIGANSITSAKIAADAITTAHLQAGAVKADQIAAGAITTGKLTVMDAANLVAGELLDPVAWNGGMNGDWSLLASTASQDELGRVMLYAGPNRAGQPANQFVSDQYSNNFPVNVGEQIAVSLKVRGYAAARGQFRCEIQFLTKDFDNVDSQNVGNQNVLFTGSTASTALTQIFNPPAGSAYARLRMRVACDASGNYVPAVVIRNISVRRAASSELIVDGAITGDKITANAISSDKIAANAITSDKISANAITASKIAAGSIDTDKLAANAITADKIDANAVTAQKIAAGAITAVKIAAGAITTDKLDADAVTADKIAANSVGARHVAAQSITARHLVLTDSSNMVPDNALQDAKAWSLAGNGNAVPYFTSVTDIGPIIRFNDNATASSGSTFIAGATSQSFNVRPGDELRFGATIDFNADIANQGVRITLNFYDANGNNVGSPSYNEAPGINYSARNVAQNATVPAGAVTAQLYIRRQVPTAGATSAGTLYVWNPFCYRRANAELIVDGSITADKANFNSLAALNLTVGNADISNLTLNGEKLVNGAISAVYYNTSSAFVPKSATTTILSRTISLADDERLIIDAFWNLRGFMTGVNAEVFYAGEVQLRVGSTVLDTVKIQGPAIDTYGCSSQPISGSYTKSGAGSVTITLVFVMGSGGAMRNNDKNMGYFGSSAGFSNDGTSWTITRLKK